MKCPIVCSVKEPLSHIGASDAKLCANVQHHQRHSADFEQTFYLLFQVHSIVYQRNVTLTPRGRNVGDERNIDKGRLANPARVSALEQLIRGLL